jgi:hypothetical protein
MDRKKARRHWHKSARRLRAHFVETAQRNQTAGSPFPVRAYTVNGSCSEGKNMIKTAPSGAYCMRDPRLCRNGQNRTARHTSGRDTVFSEQPPFCVKIRASERIE